LAAFLGFRLFGVAGCVYGPLLAGILVTIFDILKTYYSEKEHSHSAFSQDEEILAWPSKEEVI
jgi:predicted PurR-regulated permease PerM